MWRWTYRAGCQPGVRGVGISSLAAGGDGSAGNAEYNAEVVCREMVCDSAGSSHIQSFGGAADHTMPIWLDNVECSGAENSLKDCSHAGWGVQDEDCQHDEDVGVCCSGIIISDLHTGTCPTIVYNGYEYRTLDGTSPSQTASGCQSYYLPLPSGGWELAPGDAESIEVTAAHPWGTDVLVMSNGYGYRTQNLPPPGAYLFDSVLLTSGSQYRVDVCNGHILMRRRLASGDGSCRFRYYPAQHAHALPSETLASWSHYELSSRSNHFCNPPP